MLGIDFECVDPVASPARDAVTGLEAEPGLAVVSLSDVHGYLGAARSALKTVGDHDAFDPLVTTDDEGRLHWADNDYVLVFNGDLVDRGPDNERVLAMVARLFGEAPPGRVRVTLGNHEWGVLFPSVVRWDEWYSGQRDDADRRALCRAICAGHVVAAYGGHNFTYAHAGRPESYEPRAVNDDLVAAADGIADALGSGDDSATQRRLIEQYDDVLGLGRQNGRGPGAGIAWLDFRYMPRDAPPQIVGHTRQETPVRKGDVVCENVIRANEANAGGEAVLVEMPVRLVSLERTMRGGVHTNEFDLPRTDG
jgi:hypothetical protein